MSSWYYAEGNRQRRGPVASGVLLELYRERQIALDTLVWREGLDQWRPLSACADMLGPPVSTDLHAAPAPPPLPMAAPGAWHPHPAATPPYPSARGAGWPLVLTLIAIIGGFFLMAVLGMLVPIAARSYQDYLARARVTQAVADLAPLKPQIAAFLASEGRCPVNGDAGLPAPEHYASDAFASVHIGRFQTTECGIEAILRAPDSPRIDGKTVWLDLDADADVWTCSSDIDDRQLPPNCRG
ncbi:pilin [Xanthomonas melonis]|uniref:Pilin n=1 Tax=Xanthomonas melonis TaxID=56456 RepID=A0ABS8NSN2_9XANT|nr:pilin [Xanthomonas melonis]MCD0257862.1 pilin [Xanthomonas melonis]MCD0266081.1 pilin [Xanthomonas melonis]